MVKRSLKSTPIDGKTDRAWPPLPPQTETEFDRALRLEEEREAKRISDAIDSEIERERDSLRRRRSDAKILLLGQSESGKSTILKNFQLHFSPNAFREETEAWRAVIYLNLIRSVNFILDILATRPASVVGLRSGSGSADEPLADTRRRLGVPLSPLRQVELALVARLSAEDLPNIRSPASEDLAPRQRERASEVSIQGGSGWKALINRRRQPRTQGARVDEVDSARQVISACRENIVELWADNEVQKELAAKGIRLQDQPGFFLDQAERIAREDYEPTFDDILRARLRTMGVEVHQLVMETREERGQQWTFYDVGGVRGQRASWVPYFDDLNALIFVCSVAGFNEVLMEDSMVNRLHDSFNIWKSICSSKILSDVTFIVLLNKHDVVDAKLKAGVLFVDYVRSYKGANSVEPVSKYLLSKFISVHNEYSLRARPMHAYLTCAIDRKATVDVLLRIRDAILTTHLMATDIL